MSTQIVLNDKLLCTDLDETNVFGKLGHEVWEKNSIPFYYLLEHLMSMKSIRPANVRGEMRYCPLFHSCCPRSAEETSFYYIPHCKEEAENILLGFPLFLKTVLGLKPNKYCRSRFLQQMVGGKFDPETRKFVSKSKGPAILEYIQVEVPNEESFLSAAENNAMARDEDEITEATNLRKVLSPSDKGDNDDVSTILTTRKTLFL